jgi:hypothetical protein
MFLGSVVLAMARKRVTLLPRAAQEYRDHFVMLLTPHGRTGGAGRRVACEQQRDPEPMPELCGPASPCSTRGACGRRGTTRQLNTHITESREVCYPWHPWYVRSVWIYETLVKNGQAVFRCGIEENKEARRLEIPQWMFDPAQCSRMRRMAVPTVACEALWDLKVLLQGASLGRPGVVLQAQHHSLLALGGADANVREPTDSRIVSSAPLESVLAGAAPRNQTEDPEAAGATAARALEQSPRLRPPKGGAA